MTRLMSSMAEIIRVGGWGLRGLGYSYGVAERAVPLLAWTEAAVGGAMRSIRLGEADIVASYTAPRLQMVQAADGARQLSGHGRHLLEIGPPAADLVTADARRNGSGRLTLSGSIGTEFIPALANMLAHRKLAGIIIFRADASGQSGPKSAESRWVTFQPGFVAVPKAVTGDEGAIKAWLEKAKPADASQAPSLRQSITREIERAGQSEAGHVCFVAWQCEAAPVPETAENLSARAGEAWRVGVETTEDDLRYLYQLETRAWAPTSERSRSQAGYGKF